MADYLVLEEDGTSRLELEESTDDLLLEDGTFLYTKTGTGVVRATTFGGSAPTESYAQWKVGVITVPSSPGTVTVTGLGGRPDAVIFFGTNWTTEDAAVTDTGTALFRGMDGLEPCDGYTKDGVTYPPWPAGSYEV